MEIKTMTDAGIAMMATQVVIAIIASYTPLDKFRRVTVAQGHTRKFWLAGGVIARGIGIWSMHFIAKQEQARLFEHLEIERGQLEAIFSSMTDGLIVLVIITLRDITEGMQAEKALRESKESLTAKYERVKAALQIERQLFQV